MFCPNCGQQQASHETSFCSRCGFRLGVVKAVLAAGEGEGAPAGFRPAPDAALRRKDVTRGAAFMFMAALLVAAATVELPPGHSNRIIALVVAWLLLTLLLNLRPLLRYFFGDGAPAEAGEARGPVRLGRAARGTPLPPARAVPAPEPSAPQFDTGEVVPPPPSVAERTTNLLERN